MFHPPQTLTRLMLVAAAFAVPACSGTTSPTSPRASASPSLGASAAPVAPGTPVYSKLTLLVDGSPVTVPAEGNQTAAGTGINFALGQKRGSPFVDGHYYISLVVPNTDAAVTPANLGFSITAAKGSGATLTIATYSPALSAKPALYEASASGGKAAIRYKGTINCQSCRDGYPAALAIDMTIEGLVLR